MSANGLLAVLATGTTAGLLGYWGYPVVEKILLRTLQGYLDELVSLQERMFHPVPRKTIALYIAVSTIFTSMCGYIFSMGYGGLTIGFTCLMGLLGYSLPRMIVRSRWTRRIAQFDRQLVDALNLMANSLKSGLNLSQVIQVVVKELPNPISQEFGLILSQQKLGLSINEALEKMMERVPSEDLNVAFNSVLILRETGGDLSETFDVIAKTIRERRKIQNKIRSMSEQGRFQGLILFLFPFAIGIFLYFQFPDFILPLLTTRLGWVLIALMLVLQTIGGLVMRKLLKIDV